MRLGVGIVFSLLATMGHPWQGQQRLWAGPGVRGCGGARPEAPAWQPAWGAQSHPACALLPPLLQHGHPRGAGASQWDEL